jgi:hypothetical protein
MLEIFKETTKIIFRCALCLGGSIKVRLGELENPLKFKVDVLRHCLINKKIKNKKNKKKCRKTFF